MKAEKRPQMVIPRTRAELLRLGVTPGEIRGPKWQRVSRGLYVPAGVDTRNTMQRIVQASGRLPRNSAVGGWAAAHVHGAELCDGLGADGQTVLDVPLSVGQGNRVATVPGTVLWADPLPQGDFAEVGGIPVTTPLRTCFDGMRRAPDLVEAVVFADLMSHAELVDLEEVRAYVDAHRGWRGVPQARRALALADPMARNGWETRTRMVWMLDAGLPKPKCNPSLFDLHDRLLGYPDLLDEAAGVVVEYDGEGHRKPRQHSRDNLREERFEEHGLTVMRVTRVDFDDQRDLALRMQRTRNRGLARDRRFDQWTLEPPPDWEDPRLEQDMATALADLDWNDSTPW